MGRSLVRGQASVLILVFYTNSTFELASEGRPLGAQPDADIFDAEVVAILKASPGVCPIGDL